MKAIDTSVLDEMQRLQDTISRFNYLHFVEDKSEISDEEFDELTRTLNKLKSEHPAEAKLIRKSQAVVPMVGEGTKLETKVISDKMLSLNKAYSEAELDIFFRQQPEEATFNYEYKLDGLALELNYSQGVLTEILTRYDGANGEVVTHALPLFNNIPLEVPAWKDIPNRRVRGEGYITYANFKLFNEMAITPAKNPRNSTSGWIRALKENQNPLVKGLLSYNVYWCDSDLGEETYDDVMERLEVLGFTRAPVVNELYVKNNVRSTIYPVDGIVIKVNELAIQRKQGNRSNSPRWAIAYKFPAENAETTLMEVIWQVGRTGAVTPVAIYSPVMLMGVECTRATIHNYRRFMSHKLRVGSRIIISRNGDVIPHLARVVDEGKGKVIHAPTSCPSCGSLLAYEGENDEAIHLRCYNVSSCPAQLAQRCYNLVDKHGFDIDGIGLTTVTKWIEEGLVKNPADIFLLPESAMNARTWDNLHAGKTVPLNKFIKALSLPGVGEVTAMSIAKAIASTMKLDDKNDIIAFLQHAPSMHQVPDVGVGTALEVSLAVQDSEFIKMYNKLMEVVTIVPPVITDYTCKVAISGSATIGRSELEELFRENGIELTNKVGKDCKWMLTGQRPSKAKITKANKLGLPILDVADMSSMKELVEKILA